MFFFKIPLFFSDLSRPFGYRFQKRAFCSLVKDAVGYFGMTKSPALNHKHFYESLLKTRPECFFKEALECNYFFAFACISKIVPFECPDPRPVTSIPLQFGQGCIRYQLAK
jgi:hypothetical protein